MSDTWPEDPKRQTEMARLLDRFSGFLSEVPAIVDCPRCRAVGNVIQLDAAHLVSSFPKYAVSGVIPPSDE